MSHFAHTKTEGSLVVILLKKCAILLFCKIIKIILRHLLILVSKWMAKKLGAL